VRALMGLPGAELVVVNVIDGGGVTWPVNGRASKNSRYCVKVFIPKW
jgi:hypothetical protein